MNSKPSETLLQLLDVIGEYQLRCSLDKLGLPDWVVRREQLDQLERGSRALSGATERDFEFMVGCEVSHQKLATRLGLKKLEAVFTGQLALGVSLLVGFVFATLAQALSMLAQQPGLSLFSALNSVLWSLEWWLPAVLASLTVYAAMRGSRSFAAGIAISAALLEPAHVVALLALAVKTYLISGALEQLSLSRRRLEMLQPLSASSTLMVEMQSLAQACGACARHLNRVERAGRGFIRADYELMRWMRARFWADAQLSQAEREAIEAEQREQQEDTTQS